MQSLGQGAIHHGSAQAVVSFVGAVLVVRFSGVLTAAALAGITQSLRQMCRPDTRAFVADYRGAVLATTAWRLDELCRGESRLGVPGALVARGLAQDILRLYALRASGAGIDRVVSPDLEWATRWAQERLRE